MKRLILIVLLSFSAQMFCQDLVYKPRNPNFGGDTFNYQWLLSSAEAQNTFEDPNAATGREEQSELERFADNLNSQLLSQVSRTLFQQQFGDTNFTVGTYSFGTFVVDITPSNQGLTVNILDTSTGEQSQIIIPN